MKKSTFSKVTIFAFILYFIAINVLWVAPAAWADGSVTQTYTYVTNKVSKLKFSWTADASNGSVPSTESEHNIDGYVVLVKTIPGDGTAPTNNYSITLTDEDGLDVMGGEIGNSTRSNSTPQQNLPRIGDPGNYTYLKRWISCRLTFNLTGNSVNDATGETVVFIERS